MDIRLKPGIKQHVQAKVAANECLCCGSRAKALGLCNAHYFRYRNVLLKQPLLERESFKANLIREGKLLSSRQGQRFDLVNEFEV